MITVFGVPRTPLGRTLGTDSTLRYRFEFSSYSASTVVQIVELGHSCAIWAGHRFLLLSLHGISMNLTNTLTN